MSSCVPFILFDTWHILMPWTVDSFFLLVLVGSSQLAASPYTSDIVFELFLDNNSNL